VSTPDRLRNDMVDQIELEQFLGRQAKGLGGVFPLLGSLP